MDLDVAQRVTAAFSLVLVLGLTLLLAVSKRLRPRGGSPAWFLVFVFPANVILAIGLLIDEPESKTGSTSLCLAQATLVQYGIVANFIWYTITSLAVYFSYRQPNKLLRTIKWYKLAILIAYGVSLAIALPLAFSSSNSRGSVYGPTRLWCGITTSWQPLRLVFTFVPVWTLFFCTPVLSYLIYIHKPHQPDITLTQYNEHAIPPLSIHNSSSQPTRTSTPIPPSVHEDPFTGLKITSITITSEKAPQPSISTQSTHSQSHVSRALEFLRKPPFAMRQESATTLVLDPVQADVEQRGYRQYEYNISTTDLPRSAMVSVDIARKEGLTDVDDLLHVDRPELLRAGVLLWLDMLMSWVPYSVVEVYTLTSHTPPHALLLTTAVTFPLLGFWHCLVWIYLQRAALRDLFARA